jgi:hypothetical protein
MAAGLAAADAEKLLALPADGYDAGGAEEAGSAAATGAP